MDDFQAGKLLRINNRVDAYALKYLFVLQKGVFRVIYTRYGLLGAQAVGQNAAHDIMRLVRHHTYKQIRLLYFRIIKRDERSWRCAERKQIEVGSDVEQLILIFIDEGYVVVLFCEEFSQMPAYCAGAYNNDFHFQRALLQWVCPVAVCPICLYVEVVSFW